MRKGKAFLLSVFGLMLLLSVQAVYSACIGTYYCDNTPAGATRECSATVGTYNGSFANKPAWHNWTLVTTGSYINFTASILGEANDDLNLRVYLPNGSFVDQSGPGSSKAISVCSAAGTYKTRVEAFTVPDFCAPYNITFLAVGVGCCQDSDCNDTRACSLDTCSSSGCIYCTQANYNVSTCNNYPCCSGLQQCFDGICRATCPDFSISLSPTSLSITVPQTGYNSSRSTINITSINGFSSAVSFSGSWIGPSPTGVTFYFTPSSVTPPANGNASTNVTINVSSTASPGTYTLRVNATSGFVSRYADLTVNISPSPVAPFDFNVSVSPSSGSVVQGSWINTTVTVTLLSGSPQTVTLSVSGLPSDATATFIPSSSGTPTFSRTLNISTRHSTPNGTYSITITGTGGGLTRTATYTLTVNPSPLCVRANPTVSISPSSQTGRAGQTLTYTVTVTNKDSTACGESTFSLVGIVPSGFSHSFSQPTLVIKPVGFTNSNSSYFYVTSNCSSAEGSHPIRVNVTNMNAPSYFALSSYSYYYVNYHFSVSIWDSPQTGISGSTRSYRVYLYNYRWTTCPASTFTLTGSVPAGWSYTITPNVTLSPGTSTSTPRFNVTSPCTAAPGSYTIQVTANDTSTGITKTASGNYTVATPSCSIRATPFFSTGPFSSTVTATFYNLNTTCFPTATLDCGQGTRTNVPISGSQAATTCFYPAVAMTTYYTTSANVSANINVVCQTTVVDNPDVFNFSVSVSPGVAAYSGLVGFWPFDEGWGISSADRRYGNNASLGVTNWEYVPTWTQGRFGYGLGFDGTNDYVRIINVPVNTSAGAYNTVGFWMYWNGGNNQMPFGWQQAYSLWIIDNCFGFNTGNNDVLGVSSIGLSNRWVHVVAVFYNGVPSSTTVALYIDGIKQNIYQCRGSSVSRSVTSTLQISGWANGSGYYFGGIIDEFKVWNKALSDQEVLAEYQLAKVAQGQKHFANVSTTLLTGSSQPVSLSLTGCPPNAECSLIPNTSNPTYNSVLTVSTSAQTPTGNYTMRIIGTNGSLTKEMNYTIEVVGLCVRSNPSIVISPSLQQGERGKELYYSIHLTNEDSSACPASKFSVELQPLFNTDGWKFDNATWVSGWWYRQTVTIDNTANPNLLTDYQVLLNLDTASLISAGKMNLDCSDVRFTDSDGNAISYWLESGCNSASTRIWVKVPSIPASATKAIYVYYGNLTATSQSSTTNTFIREIDGIQPVKGAWTFDEGLGTRAYDYSGYGNNGTLYNGPTWVSGKFGKGLRFDGIDDYVDVGNSSSLNPTQAITVEAWIYPIGWGENGMGRIATRYYSYQFYVYSDGSRLSFYFWNSSGLANQAWSKINSIRLNEWQHVAVTYDGEYVRFYVNGIPAGESLRRVGPLQVTPTSLYIGNRPGLDRTFNGTIDEVKIYNRALTADEINSLFNNYGYATPAYPGRVLVRKYTPPEPTVKIGVTLSPQESMGISLKVNSSATATGGTYEFNITASSATGSNSATGIYSISALCEGLADGTCIGDMQVCRNGIPQHSCGDSECNCGENENTCNSDCTGVYYMLKSDWHLISLPYKKVVSIGSEDCGANNLSFLYFENYTWKKVVGILNIKGGYGYWVNPSWFTKAEWCTINLTVDRFENISVEDIPKLKRGFNTIGSTHTETKVEDLKCIDDFGNQVPIRVVYYWDVDKKWVVADSIKQRPPWYYGYWIYVDNDCKLTK